jgi:hypothetical protein
MPPCVALDKVGGFQIWAADSCQNLASEEISMRTVKKISPSAPQKKTLKQVKIKKDLTELVRGNLIALLRDRIAQDLIHNSLVEDYELLMTKPKYSSKYKLKKGQLEGWVRRDVSRWSIDRLVETTGLPKSVLRKIFEEPPVTTSSKKPTATEIGKRLLRFDEVITLAFFFGVSPGYLLQPFREHLENMSLLEIHGLGDSVITISAHEWLEWVHGFGQHISNDRLMQLSATEDTKHLKAYEMSAPEEITRFLSSTYGSEVNASIVANMQFHPMLAPKPKNPHPMDLALRRRGQVPRMRWSLTKRFSYMTNARRALQLIDQTTNPVHLKQAIDWSVELMREDLASLAANKEDVGPKK